MKTETTLGKNALLNCIKQACSVIFPFISFAYCSRIIGKEGIGIYSFSQSVVSYFILLAVLGIPNYAIREGARFRDDENKIKSFINQVFSINLVSMTVSYIILFFTVLRIPRFELYWNVILILSLQLLLNTLGADWINSIFEDYIYLTIRYIVLQIISVIFLFLFVRTSSDLVPYTIITMLSNAGGNIFNLFYLKRNCIYPRITRTLNLRNHLRPILILFANSIAGIIYLNSDITMLGFYLQDSEVGIYTVSSKIYSISKTLINAIIMVTIPRFSYLVSKNNIEEYKEKLDTIINFLLLICVPAIILLMVESDKILHIVAGNGYESGVLVVKVLAVTMIFAVGACFFSYSVLMPNGKEKEFMIATVVAALLNIILNIWFIPLWGIIGAAFTTMIAELVVVSIAVFYSRNIVLPKIDIGSLCSILIGGLFVYGVCKITDAVLTGMYSSFVVEVIISSILYILFLAFLKNKYVFMLFSMLKGLLIK